jgi:hypothetical protein
MKNNCVPFSFSFSFSSVSSPFPPLAIHRIENDQFRKSTKQFFNSVNPAIRVIEVAIWVRPDRQPPGALPHHFGTPRNRGKGTFRQLRALLANVWLVFKPEDNCPVISGDTKSLATASGTNLFASPAVSREVGTGFLEGKGRPVWD